MFADDDDDETKRVAVRTSSYFDDPSLCSKRKKKLFCKHCVKSQIFLSKAAIALQNTNKVQRSYWRGVGHGFGWVTPFPSLRVERVCPPIEPRSCRRSAGNSSSKTFPPPIFLYVYNIYEYSQQLEIRQQNSVYYFIYNCFFVIYFTFSLPIFFALTNLCTPFPALITNPLVSISPYFLGRSSNELFYLPASFVYSLFSDFISSNYNNGLLVHTDGSVSYNSAGFS